MAITGEEPIVEVLYDLDSESEDDPEVKETQNRHNTALTGILGLVLKRTLRSEKIPGSIFYISLKFRCNETE